MEHHTLVLENGRAERAPASLRSVLERRFGHSAFRPSQEEVCRAVASGEDALLVMPTGSGKSLCYQLPGIARGSTTLVISPLIALMEDQTAKLQALGFRAERIHSGRSREESREVSRRYLAGQLDFLTIAPERLSVPGFPEMLAKRALSLIAVDEAHCISQWGHDFRPDYRLLKERLPVLRPAPILAMTATATVRVQRDILEQLGIPRARAFIRGFRRDNLAIEAVARPRGDRTDDLLSLLAPKEHRPAVIYVPTRRMADELAASLSRKWSCASYHAGLTNQERARAQEAFLSGELELVVATIAFGMGIDKPDIRTVVHMALPGTLEGYYQEIGRAGRDGKPARAVLLYSYADMKVHESFFERDYPELSLLETIVEALPQEGMARSELVASLPIPPERQEPAIDKLWIHGAIKVDGDDRVTLARGAREKGAPWRKSYEALRLYRSAQVGEVLDFAQGTGCRMERLVRYFGERSEQTCARCDSCSPNDCIAKRFRAATKQESSLAAEVIRELRAQDGLALGRLYRALGAESALERRSFERLIEALVRAGAIAVAEDSFEKDGEVISFRRAHLAPGWKRALDEGAILFEAVEAPTSPSTKGAKRPAPAAARTRPSSLPSSATVSTNVSEALREWRRGEAKRRGVPAFRILTDRVLFSIAEEEPDTLGALARISGVTPRVVEKYGQELLSAIERA